MRDADDDAPGKSAAALENEINDARAELGAVLDALERRLAPRQLLEKGVDMLKETLRSDGGALAEMLRSNPLPLALIGAGAGWLLIEATSGGRASELARDFASRLSVTARSTVGAAAESIAQSGEETAGYAYARTKPPLQAMARARERYRGAIADNPLALGLIGVVAGAAIALLLPRSTAEQRWLGTTDEGPVAPEPLVPDPGNPDPA